MKKFIKIPNRYSRYMKACREFLLCLLYLWNECDGYSGKGKFTIAQIVSLTRAKPNYRRTCRIRHSLAILVHEGLITLHGVEDVNEVKPRQVMKVTFNYIKLFGLEDSFTIVNAVNVQKLLHEKFLFSSYEQANAINVFFLLTMTGEGQFCNISKAAKTLDLDRDKVNYLIQGLGVKSHIEVGRFKVEQ